MTPEIPNLRIVLADDHVLLVEALTLILQRVGTVVATAKDGEDLVRAVEEHQPDLVITDLSMPGGSGFTAIRRIIAMPEAPPVLVLTLHDDPGTLEAALQAGAAGYVVKSSASQELLIAVQKVMAGMLTLPQGAGSSRLVPGERHKPKTLLTARQRAVIQGLIEGLTSREIAERLGIKERTVVFHRQQLRKRLGVRTPQEMIELLRRITGHDVQ